jgi:hypothetical protein
MYSVRGTDRLGMKCTIFWGITPYNPLKTNQCFGGAHCFIIQGIIRLSRYQGKGRWQCKWHLLSCFSSSNVSFVKMERYVPPKRWLDFNVLDGVISRESSHVCRGWEQLKSFFFYLTPIIIQSIHRIWIISTFFCLIYITWWAYSNEYTH